MKAGQRYSLDSDFLNCRRKVYEAMVMAKGDEREEGFQDGGCFSRFLKRERINNQNLIAFLKLTLTLTLNLTTI